MVPQFIYKEFYRLASSRTVLNEKYQRFNEHEKVVEKKGIKVMLWDKNVVFFPRKINGKFYFLHRIKPDIQIACVEDLSGLTTEYWQNYFIHFANNIVSTPKYKHEVSYIGGGCPPIETELGWLLIYHGVHDTIQGCVYTACAVLLDLKNPQKEIARLPYPLFEPEKIGKSKEKLTMYVFQRVLSSLKTNSTFIMVLMMRKLPLFRSVYQNY